MRTGEILLFLLDLGGLLGLLASRSGGAWFGAAAPLALLCALLQAFLEGPRWGLYPFYVLALGLSLAWFLDRLLGLSIPALWGRLGYVSGFLCLLLGLAASLAFPVFHFPQPGGPYAVGTLSLHFDDEQREEIFLPGGGTRREVAAQIWYPALPARGARHAPYLEDASVLTPWLAKLAGYPAFLFEQFRYVKSPAYEGAPPDTRGGPFPLLIYLTGQNGFRSASSFQILELASRGYVIIGLDQPGASAAVLRSDGRIVPTQPRSVTYPLAQQRVDPRDPPPLLLGRPMPEGSIPYFAADVGLALDRLARLPPDSPAAPIAGIVDLDRVGVFGVSLGGLVAAEASFRDPRIKAALMMDVFMPRPVVEKGLGQAAMWITRDADTMRLERRRAGGWSEADIEQHQRTMRAAYASQRGPGYYLSLPGLFHLGLTDAPLWSPLLDLVGFMGPLEGRRVFELLDAYSLAFFDRYLKGGPASLLDGPSPLYPELHFSSKKVADPLPGP